LIVGYFVWTISIKAYQETASDITKEAQWGTLEQLHLTPYGIGRVVLFTSFANVLITLLMGGVVLGAMIVTSMIVGAGVTLRIDLVTIFPIAVLTVFPVIGIGLFFGGLALLYKRVGQAASLMQLVFIVFLAVPVDGHPLSKFLPLSMGTAMLNETIVEGTALWQFPAADLAVLAGTTALYLGGGYLVFHLLQQRARKKGVLGHY
jgi:ABC-2 type transport system permease protein